MLLYVDKKKQKRQKIKKILYRVGIILFLSLNLLHFPAVLHTPQKSLYAYPIQTYTTDRNHDALPITIFTDSSSPTIKLILIPPTLNRKTLTTFIYALTLSASQTTDIQLTPELADNNIITQTLQTIIPQQTTISETSNQLVITSNFNAIYQEIVDKRLLPKTLSYAKTNIIADSTNIVALLDQFFPLPTQPHTKLEKEQTALKNFAEDYQYPLKKYIEATHTHLPTQLTFSDMNTLLQNTPLCIETEDNQACSLNMETSLLQNIKNALYKLPTNSTPQRLILLTSTEPVTIKIPLEKDEGLLFKFEQRQELLLPREIATTQNSSNTIDYQKLFILLKQKAGINPDYSNNKMEFYKFKTVEIKL